MLQNIIKNIILVMLGQYKETLKLSNKSKKRGSQKKVLFSSLIGT